MTRYAEEHPHAAYGAVFVTDRSERADEVYRELDALLPEDKVAVWTREHGHLFTREALRLHPVAIVNNQFYFDKNGHHARNVTNLKQHLGERALTIVDERPKQVDTYEIILSDAQKARETFLQTHPEHKPHLDKLFQLMERYASELPNKICLPEDVSDALTWFASSTADRLAGLKINAIDQLFGFARALVQGCGFALSGNVTRYVGYAPKGCISPGTVLLDATADIDGVTHIVSNRTAIDVPSASYENLEIVHVPQHTTQQLKKYFATGTNQKAYVRSMVQVIAEHMKPGEYGLVVCKKNLIDQQRVPNWPEDDPRFTDTKSFTEKFAWNIGGRHLCVVHWGSGIGSNLWKRADVVFLMDEFHLPRRTAAAHVHGIRGQTVHEGPIAAMKTINSKSPMVDVYGLGHRLRHLKQMALRGRARCYDEHGVCGKMRLVISCELETFLANVEKLFPGATPRITGANDNGKWAERVLATLSASTDATISTTELGRLLGKDWRKVRFRVVTEEFLHAIGALGWRYVPGKGRRAGQFERLEPREAMAA